MAFKGSVIHIPAPRRPKWWKRQTQAPAPAALYLHLGNGRALTFDNVADLRRFAETRGWKPK